MERGRGIGPHAHIAGVPVPRDAQFALRQGVDVCVHLGLAAARRDDARHLNRIEQGQRLVFGLGQRRPARGIVQLRCAHAPSLTNAGGPVQPRAPSPARPSPLNALHAQNPHHPLP